jgi:hypothetical protein
LPKKLDWIWKGLVALGLSGGLFYLLYGRQPALQDSVVLEEAQRKYGKHVRVGEEKVLSKEEFFRDLEEEKREEAKKYAAYPYNFSITLFLPIGPIERGERFEDPLRAVLGDFGVVLGGGSSMKQIDGKMVITDVGFSVRTKELQKGLGLIRKSLKEQGAPKDTRIRLKEPTETLYGLDE